METFIPRAELQSRQEEGRAHPSLR